MTCALLAIATQACTAVLQDFSSATSDQETCDACHLFSCKRNIARKAF